MMASLVPIGRQFAWPSVRAWRTVERFEYMTPFGIPVVLFEPGIRAIDMANVAIQST